MVPSVLHNASMLTGVRYLADTWVPEYLGRGCLNFLYFAYKYLSLIIMLMN